MSMSMPVRVVHKRRATITALPLYYSGFLLMKYSDEKDFKRYYGELRGATLFLYKDDTQDTYTEKLDLEKLKSMRLESPYARKMPAIFTLTMHVGEVQLKMENADMGEEWRCYILTMVKKEIPSKVHLLPGQILLLREALDQEKRRNPGPVTPPIPPRPSFLLAAAPTTTPPLPKETSDIDCPSSLPCFFRVTRREAEQMLEANPENGHIIIRPSTLTNNYALTLRQVTDRGPVFKNFRLTATNPGFVIHLENALTVPSLNDVLQYFLEKTNYRLHPYAASTPYDTCLEVVPHPKCNGIPQTLPRSSPAQAPASPLLHLQAKGQLMQPNESEYVVPDDDDSAESVNDTNVCHEY